MNAKNNVKYHVIDHKMINWKSLKKRRFYWNLFAIILISADLRHLEIHRDHLYLHDLKYSVDLFWRI